MSYIDEMSFLRDTLKKCNVKTLTFSPSDLKTFVPEYGLYTILKDAINIDLQRRPYGKIESETVYKFTDEFKICYMYFLIPSNDEAKVFFMGPYIPAPISLEELRNFGKELGIPQTMQSYFEEYYCGVPILPEGDSIFILISTFCERIWNTNSFTVVDLNNQDLSPASPINKTVPGDNFDDIMASMKIMENRYSFENELLRAVSLGQIHKDTWLFSKITEKMMERRLDDPLRNAKNYSIIMNTLLRKAAEQGGVHPYYLNRMSSDFAKKIESLSSLSKHQDLMINMFHSYCRLVRKYSMKSYSPVVQKKILIIDSDHSADISLISLAKSQNISAGYLATIFKKETGKTISEYLREKRVNHAKYLLRTTKLQIQAIALQCGIIDMQYFSKLFKKETGKTPKEYRESIKQEEMTCRDF